MGRHARDKAGALAMRYAAVLAILAASFIGAMPAVAGPPYVTDDPQPTDEGHYEIYGFAGGTTTQDGNGGGAGFDLNYGAAKDLQLTMVLPLAFDGPRGGPVVTGFGNVEIAAKYKFLHQEDVGLDVAIFPRLIVPTRSDPALGEGRPSLFIPIFAQKDFGDWSIFGGGGCTLASGRSAPDFCQMGLTVTRRVTDSLQLGVELYHQTPDVKGARHMTGIGVGAIYDINPHYHLMASAGPGIQNADATNEATWYAALLFTY
jgi:hypothetical protein